jgi:hypothetical protein
MKVFFIGSPRFKWVNQQSIYEMLSKLGHEHTSTFTEDIRPKEFYDADEDEWARRYKMRLREIQAADFCVFEASTPSHAIGQLVQEAVRKEIPVIVLHTSDYKPVFMAGSAIKEKRLQVLKYTRENLKQVIEYGMETVKDLLTTRFTMLMPASMVKFLDRVGSELGVSKSEFIRDLISEKMGENES